MAGGGVSNGWTEISGALLRSRGHLWSAAVFSGFVNLLMLTGPLFMVQVYDRVLASRSVETLTALILLVTFLFIIMAMLDTARGRIMTRCAARLQAGLDRRVFMATLTRSGTDPTDRAAGLALRDLEAMQKALSAPVVLAAMDLPWVPIFLAAIFLFHPLLGWLAFVGGAVLIAATCAQQRVIGTDVARAAAAATRAEQCAGRFRQDTDVIRGLGMQDAAWMQWQSARGAALTAAVAVADTSGAINAVARAFRLFLQSAMLALGAWLTLNGQLSSGAMMASSVLLGRALAPLEGLIGGWPLAQRALQGRRRLAEFLTDPAPAVPRAILPNPRGALEVRDLSVMPPGAAKTTLRQLSFRLHRGQCVGVVGPSGAGKTTLVRAVAGIWKPDAGTIRLDGATLDQYGPERLGAAIGYLPQQVTLFEGTIAANIARLSATADPECILGAAKLAGAHEMITALVDGYDTLVSPTGSGCLSGGQIQRIGLARALFGDPALLILDEPDSSLDGAGIFALAAAIRRQKAKGGAVLLTAHRTTILRECDFLLALDNGSKRSFGPRDAVLAALSGPVNGLDRVTAQAGAT